MNKIVFHSATLSPQALALIQSQWGGAPVQQGRFWFSETVAAPSPQTLDALRQQLQCDINVVTHIEQRTPVRLVISDMDSTFINIECIDEIADFVGRKPEVAAITEAAMRGELDFQQSLRKRVSLLKGVSVDALSEVYEQRLRLNPGALELLAGLKQRDIRFALVSGGFTFFTSRLQRRCGLDFVRANELGTADGALTGEVVGPIVDGAVKRSFLLELCEQMAIDPQQAIALGDGANDLPMMAQAGLGVAYRAKPKVREQASCQLNVSGLEKVLDLIDCC